MANPFTRRSRSRRARDRAELAAGAAREAAQTLRDRADAILGELDAAELPPRRRRPVLVFLLLGGIVAAFYIARKAFRPAQGGGGVPSPGTVTPTAPGGPTDERLNDPALKAKVESELFADDDVPKGKVSIDVADGVVTLRGTLDSADLAGELADRVRAVEGVRRVENGLAA